MSTLTINAPAYIRIANTSDTAKRFQAYKENFTTVLAPKSSIAFSVKHPGVVLYYLQQAENGLVVEQSSTAYTEGTYNASGKATDIITTPAQITLTNVAGRAISFIPYKENFSYAINAGDSVVLQADNVGQVLYYLSQEIDGALHVAHEAVDED